MATSTSEARCKVSLDSNPFEKNAKAIADAAANMSKAVNAALAATGIALLGVLGAKSISGIVDSIKEVIDLGEMTANAGKKAGLAAGQFYLFNAAVEKGLGMRTVAGLIGENAEVLNRSANIFRDAAIKLWAVGEKIRGFWLGLMDRLAPVLSRLLDGALAQSLVSAGQAFGDAIAKAGEVIYQLAADGQLWDMFKKGFKIAFDYAGELLIWLAGVGYSVFETMVTEAFTGGLEKGISDLWDSAKAFAENVGEQIGTAFFNFWTDVIEVVNTLLTSLDIYLNKLHLLSAKDLASNVSDRAQYVSDRRVVGEDDRKPATERIADFGEKIAKIFSSKEFKPSSDLSDDIDKFQATIQGALGKYGQSVQDNPTKTFENNTRRAAFGADSLAGIGAGGNVYLGLSVLDVQKSQLAELRSINAKLGGGQRQTNSFTVEANAVRQGISRAQTASPVASAY